MPHVSIITVSYNMSHLVRHFLEALSQWKPEYEIECFLIDNGSSDDVIEMAQARFPWVKIHALKSNHGLSAADNVALRSAKGTYIMHLNPDLTIIPKELEQWIAWMDAHPEIALSGPRLINPDGSDQDSCYRFPSYLIPVYRRTFLGKLPWAKKAIAKYLMRDMDRAKEQEVDWVLGAAMLARREILEKVGGFDERFFLYFEDTDLCRRLWSAGHKVCYTPAAKLVHYYGRDSRTKHVWDVFRNPITRIHIQSAIKYFWKHKHKLKV